MNLRKKWTRWLGNFGGSQWLQMLCYCYGDGHLWLDGYDGKEIVAVRFRPAVGNVEGLIRSLLAKHDSVPAYALSDALREEMEGDPSAIRLSDMLKATL